MKLRFSISTLLTTILLLASLAALWKNSDPWFPRFEAAEPGTIQADEISSDGKWFLYFVGNFKAQKAEWVLWNLDEGTAQRYDAFTGKPFPVPAILDPQRLRSVTWYSSPNNTEGADYLYNLRTNSAESLSYYRDDIADDHHWMLLTPPGKVPRLLNTQTGEDRLLPFLSEITRHKSISKVAVGPVARRILCDHTLFDLDSGVKIAEVHPSHYDQLFSPDERTLLLTGEDSTRLYDAETGKLQKILECSKSIFSSDNKYVTFIEYKTRTIRVYRLKPGLELLWERKTFSVDAFQIKGDQNLWIQYDEVGDLPHGWRQRGGGYSRISLDPYQTSLECIDWETGKTLAGLKSLDAVFYGESSRVNNGVFRSSFRRGDEIKGHLFWNTRTGSLEINRRGIAFESADKSRIFVSSSESDSAYVADADGVRLWSFPPDVRLDSLSGEKSGRFLNGSKDLTLWERRRNERIWGLATLPEFWTAVGCFGLCIANVVHIRRRRKLSPSA